MKNENIIFLKKKVNKQLKSADIFSEFFLILLHQKNGCSEIALKF